MFQWEVGWGDIAQPILAIILLVAYRKGRPKLANTGSPLAIDAVEASAAPKPAEEKASVSA